MWHTETIDQILYITDGIQKIRIGHTRYKLNHPFALIEIARRLQNPHTQDIKLTPPLLEAYLKKGIRNITYILKKNEIPITHQEAQSLAGLNLARAIAYFKPNPDNTLYTYYTRILYNTIGEICNHTYRPEYNQILKQPKAKPHITQKITDTTLQKTNYHTLTNDEEQKGQKHQPIIPLNTLNKRDRDIIHQYYHNDQTLQQIGDKYNLSRERIRQLHETALNTLRLHLNEPTKPVTSRPIPKPRPPKKPKRPKLTHIHQQMKNAIITTLKQAGGTLPKKKTIQNAIKILLKCPATYEKIIGQLIYQGIITYTKERDKTTGLLKQTYTLNVRQNVSDNWYDCSTG